MYLEADAAVGHSMVFVFLPTAGDVISGGESHVVYVSPKILRKVRRVQTRSLKQGVLFGLIPTGLKESEQKGAPPWVPLLTLAQP